MIKEQSANLKPFGKRVIESMLDLTYGRGYNENEILKHILIVGTTGAGKSKAMQRIAEQLATKGIRICISDIKRDFGGIVKNAKALEIDKKDIRIIKIHKNSADIQFPISDVPIPIISKILGLSEAQEEALYVLIGERKHRLSTIKELYKEVERSKEQSIDKRTKSVILRKLKVAEIKGYAKIFGKRKPEIKGRINILLSDSMREYPEIISAINVMLLNYIFNKYKERAQGIKLVILIDEAHYIFKNANKSFIETIERILRQIRSKGIGIVLATQDIEDIPESIVMLFSTSFIFRMNIYTEKGKRKIKILTGDLYDKVDTLSPGECVFRSGGKSTIEKWKLPITGDENYPKEGIISNLKNGIRGIFRWFR